ncbi:Aspartyl protease [Klebsormidium nitens]|uniref:Aspartyl protease n=1 Tax=Klebsormidium nitens TaxID=105231 RepID=A0A1Y1I9G1_KLENI|nr:Aspartyl protease [Klebsormidium nitens]|eukprot:GAQ87193.1 Aspartyl protease [Klebsormidium nitens]
MAPHGRSLILVLTLLSFSPFLATARRLLDDPPQSAEMQTQLEVTQIQLPWNKLVEQLESRVTFFEDSPTEISPSEAFPISASNFAAVPNIALGGSYLSSVAAFTVNVNLGTPGVSLPLVVDAGSHVNFVQGSGCVACSEGSFGCASNPYGGPSTCPYGLSYNPAQSSSANPNLSCGQCSSGADFGNVGCLGNGFSSPGTCQFSIAFGSGYAAGQYVQDSLSIGPISASSIFFGTTVYENMFEGTGGLLGFGPTATSLPFQLKAAGAIPSATFALCLASGGDTGGSLFLGGVPDQPNGQGYSLSYTPFLQTPFVYYMIPQPTDFLVGGVSVSGAAGALTGEGGVRWVVDSGTTLSYVPSSVFSAVFSAVKSASGCPNTFVNLQNSGLDFIDLSTCNPPFSANPSSAEIYARFPTLTLNLQGGPLTSRPKAYALFGRYGPQGQWCVNPGLADVKSSNVRVIGDSFMSDNLIVYDNDNNRLGFAPVDCKTLVPMDVSTSPVSTPPPSTSAPTDPPSTPAPTNPPSTPAPTNPPSNPAPTNPPSNPAPTNPPASGNSPQVFPAGGACDPSSSTPNQCYNNIGTQYTCCSGACASTPSSTPGCDGAPPANPSPNNPTPTNPSPTNPSPTTPAPNTPGPTPGSPSQGGVFPAGGVCDPHSSAPNQCYNNDGSSYTCCAGSCSSTPGSVPSCN